MIPADADLVFGRGSLRMATGEHVEVVREAVLGKTPRTYRKRFLVTDAADFRPWTARERHLLEALGRRPGAAVARLAPATGQGDDEGHEAALLRTYDAGPTVDQWATRVVLRRGGKVLGNVFEDCACWWALTRSCLQALDGLHALGFAHLDLKADNVCMPWPRAASDYPVPGQPMLPRFDQLALIDVAFSLLPGVPWPGPPPLARQPDYEYQSPRLLQALDDARGGDLAPLQALDWRCDLFSLAALLWRYLPEPGQASRNGWTTHRHAQAMSFVRLLVEADTDDPPEVRPHAELIALADLRLREPELAAALVADCTFDSERSIAAGADAVPATRLHGPPKVPIAPRRASGDEPFLAGDEPFLAGDEPFLSGEARPSAPLPWTPLPRTRRSRRPLALAAAAVAVLLAGAAWWLLLEAPARRARDEAQARMAEAVVGRSVAPAAPAPTVPATGLPTAPPRTVAPPVEAASAAAPAPSAVVAAESPSAAASSVAPAEAIVEVPASTPASTGVATGGFAAVAESLLRQDLPAIAEEAENRLAPVLSVAGETAALRAARDVRAAARSARAPLPRSALAVTVDSRQARSLNDAARRAQAGGDGFAEALRLQTRAFGADPFDPEVVGNLAYFELRATPPRPETARQLALHALTLKDQRFPSGRVQDWTSLAIADALTGREAEARGAWAVTLALADDLQRHCEAVVRAQDVYGDALRPSVAALLERARDSPSYRRCGGDTGPRSATAATKTSAGTAARPRPATATAARNDAARSRRAAAPKRPTR